MSKYQNISPRFLRSDHGARLSAERHGLVASQSLWERGIRLRQLIERVDKPCGIASILRLGLFLPLGARSWLGLREIGFGAISRDKWIRLKSPMRRHEGAKVTAVIPNEWTGLVDAHSYGLFSKLKNADFVKQLGQEIGDPYISLTMHDEKDVFLSLEASLAGLLPPSLHSAANFVADFGMPRTIDLEGSSIPGGARRRTPELELDQVELAIRELLRRMRLARLDSHGRQPDLLKLVERRYSIPVTDPRWEVVRLVISRSALPKVSGKYPKRGPKGKRRQRTSIGRILQEVGAVWKLINVKAKQNSGQQILISKPQRSILAYFIEALDEFEFTDQDISRFKVPSYVARRTIHLRRPSVFQAYYQLHLPCFNPCDNLTDAAKRILADFLHYNGRRAVCVALMTLQDLMIATDSTVTDEQSVFCRYTKNPSQRNSWLPIGYLWPDSELVFLKRFLEVCASAGIHKSTQLMQVAELGRDDDTHKNLPYTKHTVDQAQLKLRDGIVAERRAATHLGRFGFASFWNLRVLAFQYPHLRDTPLFLRLADHFWFQDEGLNKLMKLLQGITYNHSAAAASIMGLSSPEQFNSTYNRGYPLEMLAWRDILIQQQTK